MITRLQSCVILVMLLCSLLTVTSGFATPTATFIGKDWNTQGSWKTAYGADGYNVFSDTASYPTYATVSFTNTLDSTWQDPSADVRALQKVVSNRIAASKYSTPGLSFTIDINLTDGQTHTVSIYFLDWYSVAYRDQKIEVEDAANTSTILDTEGVAGFYSPAYYVWDITGHVVIKVTEKQSTGNAIASGIFFDTVTRSIPTNLKSVAGDANITLTWNPVSTASYYNVKRASASGGAYATLSTPATNSYINTGLTNDTPYYYVVTAVDSYGVESGISNETFSTPWATPSPPTNVTATANSHQITLNWSMVPKASRYAISRSLSTGSGYSQITTSPVQLGATNYTDTGLTNGTTYYYVVVASANAPNTTGSGYSTEVNATPASPAPPATPTNVIAYPGNTGVALTWNSVSLATSYNVLRSSSSSGPWTTIASPTIPNYIDRTATNGTTYYYSVSAQNSTMSSSGSTIVSATPLSSWAAAATYLSTDTSTKGSWKTVYGVDGYNVFEDPSSNNPHYASFLKAMIINSTDYVWEPTTTDARALTKAAVGSTDRIAAGIVGINEKTNFEPPNTLTFDLNFTDGNPHKVSLYFLDWLYNIRTQTITITDACVNNPTALVTQTSSANHSGKYYVFVVSGHVLIKVTDTTPGSSNVMVSGLFIDPFSL